MIDQILLDRFGINCSAQTLSLECSEDKNRYYYYTYTSERFLRTEWPFENINETLATNLVKYFAKLINLKLNFSSLSTFKLIISANIFHCQNQQYLDLNIKFYNAELVSQFSESKLTTLNSLQDQLGLELTKENFEQVFYNFIRDEYSFNTIQLLEKCEYNHKIKQSHDYISNIVDLLSFKHQIIVENKSEIILQITNAALNESFERKFQV